MRRVIGIDIAGSGEKDKTWICEAGVIYTCTPSELQPLLTKWKEENVLLCWDSPLSSTIKQRNNGNFRKHAFTRRCIEKKYENKVPPGISVGGYTAVSHWAISQYFLGYPNVGGAMPITSNPPFHLLTDNGEKPTKAAHVVEVHPALAAWLWSKDSDVAKSENFWRYKKNGVTDIKNKALLTPTRFYRLLLKSLSNKLISQLDLKQDPKLLRLEERNTNFSDREFDAFVAWLLGRLWLDDGPVKLDGNKFQGAWLVPILPESDKARKS